MPRGGVLPFFLVTISIAICVNFIQETKVIGSILSAISIANLDVQNNINSTTTIISSSYDSWAASEHNLRQIQIANSKDVFLPDWMLDYMIWHNDTRSSTSSNSTDTKYLVVRCLKKEVCGGLSDRLKAMPFYIMLANLTQRVLLIHWTKPCPLDEFLLPPQNGIDWTIDGTSVSLSDVQNNINFLNGHGDGMSQVVRSLMGVIPGAETLVQARVLNIELDGGQRKWNAWALFNMWRKEPSQIEDGTSYLGWNPKSNVTHHDLFTDVFRILFEPSPRLQRAIHDKLTQLDLVNKEYNMAQVRARQPNIIPNDVAIEWGASYAPGIAQPYDIKRHMDMANPFVITPLLEKLYIKLYSNAVECANQLRPGLPIYLASDTNFGNNMTHQQYSIRVAASQNDTTPLHIDSDDNYGKDPSDFYLIFIDLYIMAKAKCSSVSAGGFGSFPLRMSGNTCHLTHTKTVCGVSSSDDNQTTATV